jgi:hypothetical protein
MATLIEPVVVEAGKETWRVFGLRFPNTRWSKMVFEKVMAAGKERTTFDVTILNTISQPEGEAWLLVIDASEDGWYMENIDWWPGEPAPVEARLVQMICERRLRVGMTGKSVRAHYPKGMTLRPGGEMEPWIGKDQ